MTPLRQYPRKFNNIPLFRPEKWVESNQKILHKKVSEAGDDLVQVRRAHKLQVSCEFACTSDWKAIFEEFDEMESFTLSIYDARTEGYKDYTVRMEGYQSTEEVHGDYHTQSTGLYTVTFNLIEF